MEAEEDGSRNDNLHVPKDKEPILLVEVEPSYDKFAILTCIFCFFPTGIFAVLSAKQARRYAQNGETVLAQKSTRRAKILAYASLYIGLFGMAVALVLILIEYHT